MRTTFKNLRLAVGLGVAFGVLVVGLAVVGYIGDTVARGLGADTKGRAE